MNLHLRKALFLTMVSLTLPGLAFGRGKALKPRPEFKPPYDVISAYDATAQIITVGHVNSTNTSTKTFKVSSRTEIQVNGQKGTLSDIQTGMKVSVTAGLDDSVADRLVLSPAPVETK